MRTVDEIKARIAEIENLQKKFGESYNRIPLEEARAELLQLITHDIPLADLETLCEAWRENRVVALPFETTGEMVIAEGYYESEGYYKGENPKIKVCGKVCVIGATKEACEKLDRQAEAALKEEEG